MVEFHSFLSPSGRRRNHVDAFQLQTSCGVFTVKIAALGAEILHHRVEPEVAGQSLTNHECMELKLKSCDSQTVFFSEQEGNPRPHALQTGGSHRSH